MSARCTGNVWKHSRHKGSDLLVLLAIADYAKDDGSGAWPSVALLAEKTRLSERNVQYVLRKLEESGELTVERHAGPRGCHLYNITVSEVEGAKIAPVRGAKIAGAKIAGGATQRTEGVQTSVSGGAIAIAPDPLIDPSVDPSIYVVADAATRQKRKQRIPSDFGLSDRMVEWAKSKGFDKVLDLEKETDEFYDYWRGRGEPMLDWVATWQSRIRQRAQFVVSKSGMNGGQSNGRNNGRGLFGGNQQARGQVAAGAENQPVPPGFNIIHTTNQK